MNCTSLASIEIPDGVTSLPEKPSSQVVYVVEEQQYAALDFVQINPVQQQELGDLYEDMKYLIKEYRFNAPYRNMFGRGAERLKQINRLEEKQNYDNRRFMLSKMRRSLMYSKDRDIYSGAKTSGATIWESVGSGYGTWLHMVKASDVISDRNQACRDRRREQREDGTLPSLLKRHTEWWATAFYNNKYRFKMGWCFINGLIDRTLGFGTMLAANSLNAVGKVVKAPIKLLSMGFNGLSSVFHKKSAGRWIIT